MDDQVLVESTVQPCCDTCQCLATLEAQMSSADPQGIPHNDLAQQIIALKIERNVEHDQLIRRFPVEIISHIFVSLAELPSSSLRRYPAQRLLSEVCTRWRQIALATPQLWTDVFINCSKHASQVDLISRWLSRSCSLSLNLTLKRGDKYVPSLIQPLIDVLRSHSARWADLDLQLVPGVIVYKLFNNLEHTPRSSSLHLRELGYPDPIILASPLRPTQFSFFHAIPRPPAYSKLMPIEWDNLTHMATSNIPLDILFGIIRQAPRLNYWKSYAIFRGPLFQPPPPGIDFSTTSIAHVVHHSLQHLELPLEGHGIDIFQPLTLPSLRFLKTILGTHGLGPGHFTDFNGLIAFLSRSKLDPKSLEAFHFDYYSPAGSDHHHQFRLQELSAVTELSVTAFGASGPSEIMPATSNPLLSSLMTDDTQPFPSLRKLNIFLPDNTNQPSLWAALLEVVVQLNVQASGDTTAEVHNSNHSISGERTQDSTNGLQANPNSSRDKKTIIHRRPLQSILLTVGKAGDIRMKKDVLLRLQRIGPINLQVQYHSNPKIKDILQRARDEGDENVVIPYEKRSYNSNY